MFFKIPALCTFLHNTKFIPAKAQQRIASQFTPVENWQITLMSISIYIDFFLSTFFLGVSPTIHEPQLTPICTGFLEHMDNSFYRYLFDRVY